MTDNHTPRQAAAIPVREAPSVRVERASDSDDSDTDSVFVEGTAFHSGINRNAWGLTKEGAQRIADSLVECDVTASHPPLRQGRYDRSVCGGQGAPIGEVVTTEVVTTDAATLDDGDYTVKYIAEIKDSGAKDRYQNGLLTGDDYGVSVGIYGDQSDAICSVCRDQMAECDHERFEEVEVSDDEASDEESETVLAGPLYNDGKSDHLAAVFLPAYESAGASVASAEADAATATAANADQPPKMDALAASYGERPDEEDGESERDDAESASGEEAVDGVVVECDATGPVVASETTVSVDDAASDAGDTDTDTDSESDDQTQVRL